MSGDETIHKRDKDDGFEEDGDDELEQSRTLILYIQKSFRKHLRSLLDFCDTNTGLICINKVGKRLS